MGMNVGFHIYDLTTVTLEMEKKLHLPVFGVVLGRRWFVVLESEMWDDLDPYMAFRHYLEAAGLEDFEDNLIDEGSMLDGDLFQGLMAKFEDED